MYSKTIAGLIVIVFGLFGVADLLPGDERLEDIINAIVELVGIGIAWYGRVTAKGEVNALGFKK